MTEPSAQERLYHRHPLTTSEADLLRTTITHESAATHLPEVLAYLRECRGLAGASDTPTATSDK